MRTAATVSVAIKVKLLTTVFSEIAWANFTSLGEPDKELRENLPGNMNYLHYPSARRATQDICNRKLLAPDKLQQFPSPPSDWSGQWGHLHSQVSRASGFKARWWLTQTFLSKSVVARMHGGLEPEQECGHGQAPLGASSPR